MATNRNLKFYGFAYGDTPVTLDVKINGQQVFSGTVETISGPVPLSDGIRCDQTLFEVNGTDLFPVSFAGSYTHSVEVSGGEGVLLGLVLSNYMPVFGANVVSAGNATNFAPVYNGTPANSDGTPDVRSSVLIDGAPHDVDHIAGVVTWQVDSGSTLSCNLNISRGKA